MFSFFDKSAAGAGSAQSAEKLWCLVHVLLDMTARYRYSVPALGTP